MSDIDIYNAALERFESQPIGRAELYLKSTLDSVQRANDPEKYPATGQVMREAQENLRNFLKFGTASDIAEFAAWVEATIKTDSACNVPVYICDELRRESHYPRQQATA